MSSKAGVKSDAAATVISEGEAASGARVPRHAKLKASTESDRNETRTRREFLPVLTFQKRQRWETHVSRRKVIRRVTVYLGTPHLVRIENSERRRVNMNR